MMASKPVPLDPDFVRRFDDIILEMPSKFNSHDFINVLESRYKTLYDQAISQHQSKKDAVQAVHLKISQHLDNRSDIAQTGPEPSKNIRGNHSRVMGWRKT